MVLLLARVVGIGVETADMLVQEVLSRKMRDRRAVARYAGLTGSPDDSGATRREKGLARSGNARVRRGMMAASLFFVGLFMIATVLAPRMPSVIFLILAGAAFGPSASNVFAIAQRLAGPRAVGRWTGVQLFCGNMSGGVVSAVTGYLVQRSGHFTTAFFVVAGVMWLGALTWAFGVGPIEPVRWSQPDMVEELQPAT